MSTSEVDPRYGHALSNIGSFHYCFQPSSLSFESSSTQLPTSEPSSYSFHPSTPPNLFPGSPGAFPTTHSPSPEGNLPSHPKYESHTDNVGETISFSYPGTTLMNDNMAALNSDHDRVSVDSHEVTDTQFGSSAESSPWMNGLNSTHNDEFMDSPTPGQETQREDTMAGSLLSSHVDNHKTAIITKTGITGQAQKVARVCKSVRKRKTATEKTEKPKVPKLTRPLSELTKSYHHLPIRDMESWVRRSLETRRQEVAKRAGYVTRPMNSFMLYRSAFAERTKFWCLQNNHQVVSAVSGESWPLEPAAIREKYNEYAKIERQNHQAAHPGYKFSPSKAQNGRKRKSARGTDDGTDISDLEELDDHGSTSARASAVRSRRSPRARSTRATSSKPAGSYSSPISNGIEGSLRHLALTYDSPEGGAHRSSFTHNNPGMTPPSCMSNNDMNGHYYQTSIRARSSTPIPNSNQSSLIEDVTIRKTQTPGSVGNIQDLQNLSTYCQDASAQLNRFSQASMHSHSGGASEEDSKVDPALLSDVQPSIYYAEPRYEVSHGFPFGHGLADEGFGGFELGNFEMDHIFNPTSNPQIAGMDFPDAGVPPVHYDSDLLDASLDVHKLPGFDSSMQGFIDNPEPWTISEENPSHGDEPFSYDEWLEDPIHRV